jgi:hypothetical protein
VAHKFALSLVLLLAAGGTARADVYNFGAIAFNQDTGAFSYSYNWGSQQQAAADALRRCAGNCKVIGEFWNICGSLAAAKDGHYGWDGDVDENVATRRALANCSLEGGGCEIKVTVCNDVPQPVSPYTDSGRFIGRHGCWYANGTRVIGCKD